MAGYSPSFLHTAESWRAPPHSFLTPLTNPPPYQNCTGDRRNNYPPATRLFRSCRYVNLPVQVVTTPHTALLAARPLSQSRFSGSAAEAAAAKTPMANRGGGRAGGGGGRSRQKEQQPGGGAPSAEGKQSGPSFTLKVPMEIAPGYACRAMYYEEDAFYDATIVSKSKKGWLVSFKGFEDDEPQDTLQNDILVVGQVSQEALARASAAAKTARKAKGQSMAAFSLKALGSVISPPKDGAGGRMASMKESREQRKLDQAAGEAKQQRAAPGSPPKAKRCPNGKQCIVPSCSKNHPQGRDMDLHGVWESCEARCYEEKNDYFPAYAGPGTASGGVLVAFVGYEDDPCQDTAKQDIRYGPHKGASGKKKGQGDGQQKGQADKKEEKKGAGRERKAFVHPLARDGGDDGDSAAASSSSPSSLSRPGGGSGVNGHWGEQKKHDIEARAREKERDGDKRRAIDKDDQQSASHEVFTDVPDECVAYVAVTEKTADLKKQLLITFCTENLGVTPVGVKLLFPKIIKGNPRAAPNSNKNCHRALVFFTTPADQNVFVTKGDGMCIKGWRMSVKPKTTRGANDVTPPVSGGSQVEHPLSGETHVASKSPAPAPSAAVAPGSPDIKLGGVYEAIIGSSIPSFINDDDEQQQQQHRPISGSMPALVFGVNVTRPGWAAMQVLLPGGKSCKTELGGPLPDGLTAMDAALAVAVPTGADVSERGDIRDVIMAQLEGLPSDRLHFFDDMLCGAVEFADGWYSNIYDRAGMGLCLVRIGRSSLQLGLANVAPGSADVMTVIESDRCGEDAILADISKNMWELISQKLARDYGIASPSSEGQPLAELAIEVADKLGKGMAAIGCFTYAPIETDSACTVEYHVTSEVAQGPALAAARRFGEMHRSGSQGAVSAIAPLGPCSSCSAIVARELQASLGVPSDQVHIFLQDARNLAAGAARALQWMHGGSRDGNEGAGEGAGVVRRCLHSYTCAILAGDDEHGLSYTSIPWVTLGRELPVQCTVGDLYDVREFELKSQTGRTVATVALDGCDEVTLTIDDDGLVDTSCVMEQQAVVRNVDVASSAMRSNMGMGKGKEHEVSLVALLGGIKESLVSAQ